MSGQPGIALGIDVGGTFTDLTTVADGLVQIIKVPSTPHDPSIGVMAAIAAADVVPTRVTSFAHGMTVATNALLERRGARTVLITTEGFRDILEIGRQTRPSLYDLTRGRATPLVPRQWRFTVRERMGPDGPIVPLDEDSLIRTLGAIEAINPDAVAIGLLFGFMHPDHERMVAEAVRAACPHAYVACSHEVLPEFREYERFSTTCAEAYLGPTLTGYLRQLADRTRQAGLPEPVVMQSNGGVTSLAAAATHAASCILSGPAAGVVGAAAIAAAGGFPDVLTFDMGGTSTDVAAIIGGQPQTAIETEVGGLALRLPMLDVHTVSAGGGSLAWVDDGGALHVGPRSAGSVPGPACYGRGGTKTTVTDANLVVGYLDDGATLGAEVVLDRDAALATVRRLGARLDVDTQEAAAGVLAVADGEMVRALRVISVERGLDPRDFALLAFGGAGPMHACSVSEQLGVRTILVPRVSGVLSAFGLAVSDLRRDYLRPWMQQVDEVDHVHLESVFRGLERGASAELAGATVVREADLRYVGQAFELTVRADTGLPAAVAAFHEAHRTLYGYSAPDDPLELVNVRVVASASRGTSAVTVEGPGPEGSAQVGEREALFDGAWLTVPVLERDRIGEAAVTGPAILELPGATCVVRPGWAGRIDAFGTLVLRHL